MFEQSVLITGRTNKSWTVLASLTGELALLSITILTPLAYTEHLPLFEWKSAAIGPPPARPPDPIPTHINPHPSVGTPITRKIFVDPPRRPLADLSNLQPETIALDAFSSNGVPGSIGLGQADVSALQTHIIVDPPPLPAPPKPPETAPSGPIRVSQGVQMAKLVRQVKPEYPVLAKTMRISGVVHLLGVIGKDGHIRQLQLISGNAMLTGAAIEAAMDLPADAAKRRTGRSYRANRYLLQSDSVSRAILCFRSSTRMSK
jgi:protein TonB